MRENISTDERVAVTLSFLATGESYHSLEFSFQISRQQIPEIVSEKCEALYSKFAPDFIKAPNTEEDYLA